MPNRTCPRCARRLPYAGRRCIHCDWKVGDPGREPRGLRTQVVRMLVVVLLATGAVGLAYRHAPTLADWYAGFAAQYLPDAASSFGPAATEAGAFFYCARQVSRRMEGEFSVETFPSRESARTTELGVGRFQFVSYVDEARLDGSRVRYQFTCTVHFERGRWVLQELELTPRLADAR